MVCFYFDIKNIVMLVMLSIWRCIGFVSCCTNIASVEFAQALEDLAVLVETLSRQFRGNPPTLLYCLRFRIKLISTWDSRLKCTELILSLIEKFDYCVRMSEHYGIWASIRYRISRNQFYHAKKLFVHWDFIMAIKDVTYYLLSDIFIS